MRRKKPTGKLARLSLNDKEILVDITDVDDITLVKGVRVVKKNNKITVGIPIKQYRGFVRELSGKGFVTIPVSKHPETVTSCKPSEYNKSGVDVKATSPRRQARMYKAIRAKGGRKLPKPKGGSSNSNGKKGEANGN